VEDRRERARDETGQRGRSEHRAKGAHGPQWQGNPAT
jgi:hypothetical protein